MTRRASYWTEERLADAEARELQGETIAQIASSHGRHYTSLYRALNLRGSSAWRQRTGWAPSLNIPDDPAVCAYLAGVIDSDGSFHISHTKDGVYWRCKVSMTVREVPDFFAQFGGKVVIENRETTGRKKVYSWRASRHADLAHLLDRVEPYLLNPVRVERAALIRQWLKDRPTKAHRVR